ncbi:hypothetical protein MSAN_00084300 [Mycena sanguinolenta]|uniref:F-box domain-containing protein n=1 Tax=Mycena sanguinolenta TaxID=230812 RepID=A0A8H6ZCY5_9AGAR|nr:hypothetical protein MSAN_00084300 [Mycena sanguinolenta]
MDAMYQNMNRVYEHKPLPKKLWNAGREISRLFFSGDRWNLSFTQVNPPVHRLSWDVLSEIFLWSLPSNGFQPLNTQGRISSEPLALSHVCNRWRDVAVSTPSLWSTIWVDRPREVHIAMVKLWIEYSRQCPLILYLRQSPLGQSPSTFMDAREHELTDKILLILAHQLHRWKRVTFLFTHDAQLSLLNLPDKPSAAPLLEHIHMSTKAWDADNKLAIERIMYSYASVQSVVVHEFLSQEFIRWESLTVLDASQLGCPTESHLSVLEHCASLRRADLRVTQDHVDSPFVRPTRRVHVPCLSSLTIQADRVDLAMFFDCLVLPALEGLVLRYSSTPRRSHDPHALERLVIRSSCVLKRFSLKDAIKGDAHHLSFLRSPHMASLLELYMQVDMTNNIIRFLTLASTEDEDGRPQILPNLQTISLRDMQGDHVDDLELYRMVVSRFPGPGLDRNGRYSGSLIRAYFHLRVKGHSTSPVLPLLVERCRERIDLRIFS